MYLKYLLIFYLIIICFKIESIENKIVEGPQVNSVFERKLNVKEISKENILNNHKSYYNNTADTRVLTKILGFIETPRALHHHNSGLKDAITFAEKFSMLSPFQLEIQRVGSNQYEISGTNWLKENKKWIKDLSEATQKEIRVLPIIKFVNWKLIDFLSLAASDEEIINLGLEVLQIAQDLQLHGLILDIWPAFYGKVPTSLLIFIIQEISARLRYDVRMALLLIPPEYANEHVINREIFEILTDFVNNIVLQSYDYSSAWTPGPNSPVSIVEKYINYLTPDPLIKRDTIIVGLNFFGTAYTPSGKYRITGDDYIHILRNNHVNEFKFDEEALEHYFELEEASGHHLIYYPTLYSIHCRVRLANKLGIGLAVFNLGQGLDYFYDVL